MDFRIHLGNATPIQAARIAIDLGLDGTVIPSVGFTAEWGIESTAIILLDGTTTAKVDGFVARLFADFPNEKAVWVHDGRQGRTYHRDGRVI